MNTKELGSLGETLAAEFLVGKGYEVIAKNLRLRIGEIDLLCRFNDEIVLVEVKTLADARYFDPVSHVDQRKIRKLRQLAREIEYRFPDRNITIDVVTVGWVDEEISIHHLKDVL